ncbi:MAG: diadenylate cyclase CdaA [Candidatus Pacebacteria bacterium]|nr:diadenylate cyclase CdaA [Candidatus Paceibacterota bacterium]
MNYISVYLRIVFEIALLAFLIYSALVFMRGTRGAPILAGFTIVALLLSFMSRYLGLEVIEWLVTKMWALAALSVLIIFQPEIRRAFAEIGSSQVRLRSTSRRERERVDVLVNSVLFLASHRIGALIAIQRDIGMRAICETGTRIQAPLTKELLTTFFFPNTPLHDGGVIINGGVILAAGCIFPLTRDPEMSKSLGTRHRAGVGLTEETDAVVLIVSEESGAISLAYKGRLVRGLNRQRLERHLVKHLVQTNQQRTGLTPRLKDLQQDVEETELRTQDTEDA